LTGTSSPSPAKKETDFIDIVAWRNTAEFVSKYFTKAGMAVVEGRLARSGTWTGPRTAAKRRHVRGVVDDMCW